MKKSGILAMTTAGALAISCCALAAPALETAQAASNTTLITKYLKQYKAKKYKKAYKTLKKLKASDKDTSLKNMTKKQKKAYRKIVKKYIKKAPKITKEEGMLQGYYLVDLNKDKIPELLLRYGADEAGMATDVYTLKKNKAKKVDTMSAGHTAYAAYPGKGVLILWAQGGDSSVSVLSMKKGKLIRKEYGDQDYDSFTKYGEYCMPSGENLLNAHVDYSQNGDVIYNLKDLK